MLGFASGETVSISADDLGQFILDQIDAAIVEGALTFTPYNAANPSGFVSQAGARAALSADTGVAYNSTTGKITLATLAAGTILGRPAGSGGAPGPVAVSDVLGFEPYDAANPAAFVNAAGASAAAPVQSVAGRSGAITLEKSDVGLNNVDNTSDVSKPISTAVAMALAGKQSTIGFTPANKAGDTVSGDWMVGGKTMFGASSNYMSLVAGHATWTASPGAFVTYDDTAGAWNFAVGSTLLVSIGAVSGETYTDWTFGGRAYFGSSANYMSLVGGTSPTWTVASGSVLAYDPTAHAWNFTIGGTIKVSIGASGGETYTDWTFAGRTFFGASTNYMGLVGGTSPTWTAAAGTVLAYDPAAVAWNFTLGSAVKFSIGSSNSSIYTDLNVNSITMSWALGGPSRRIQAGKLGGLEAIRSASESVGQAVFGHPTAGVGVTGFSFSSYGGTGNPGSDSTAGGFFFGIADGPVTRNVHSIYGEVTITDSSSYAPGAEFAAVSTFAGPKTTPYNAIPAGVSSCTWTSTGRSDVAGSSFVSTLITSVPTTVGMTARTGWVIADGSLDPSYNEALSLAGQYAINWRDPNGPIAGISGLQANFISRSTSSAYPINFQRYHGAGVDTSTGDELGRLNGFQIAGSTPYAIAAVVMRKEGSTRGSGYFETANDAGTVHRAGLNMENNTLGFDVDAVINIGSPSNRANNIYLANNPIVTSDERIKTDVGDIPDALCRAVAATPLHVFKYKAAIEEKGEDGARWSTGVIAQELEAALTAQGLDPTKYSLIGWDPWKEDVTEIVEVEEDVIEIVEVEHESWEMIDGKLTQVKATTTEPRPVTDWVQAHDSDGNPLMLPGKPALPAYYLQDDEGEAVLVREAVPAVPAQPHLIPIKRRQTVSKTITVSQQKTDGAGQPMFLMNVRYEQFLIVRDEARRRGFLVDVAAA
ncbi:hypothetical protein FHS31_000846 [Sphingomonas vulcanisoli]|uniref:Peptidase S74 domain-containing protein n=1 Tax=Sphingomonas vulcanisoli TaxID=1658060 RepID=A0ABX0TRT5_9SPHN|nr:tail fiber domain-containing protein [Sphingomonas vulcanisoli]NIJ07250.1 hypothetical protein [Sphingomonas vulcanisoli]